MTIMTMFPETIYEAKDVLTKEQNDILIDEAERKYNEAETKSDNPWACNVFTSHNSGNILENPKFDVLHSTIATHVDIYRNGLNIADAVGCSEAWFNVGSGKSYQDEHIHPTNFFSAVYYIKAPEGSAPTMFSRPYNNMMQPRYTELNEVTADWINIPAEERKLIIFRSHIPHMVPSGTTEELRITHASNWR